MCKFSQAFILLSVLGLALAAPVSAAPPDKLLPANTDAVLTINVDSLLDSALVKKYALEEIKKGIRKNEQVGAILKQLNFDPLKDVHVITMAAAAGKPGGEQDVLFIVHGNFDLERVQATLEEFAKNSPDKLTISEHGSSKIYESKDKGEPRYSAFLDKDTLVVSTTKAHVENALDRGQGKEADLKKELKAALKKVDETQSVWLAVGGTEQVKEAMKRDPKNEKLADKLEAATAGLTVKDNVVTEVMLYTSDAATAKAIKDQLEKGEQTLEFIASANPDFGPLLTEILKEVKITTDAGTVKVHGEVSGEEVAEIIKKAQETKEKKEKDAK